MTPCSPNRPERICEYCRRYTSEVPRDPTHGRYQVCIDVSAIRSALLCPMYVGGHWHGLETRRAEYRPVPRAAHRSTGVAA